MFLWFFSEKVIFANFRYIFNASKFLRAHWLYDVTVTSYEVQSYLFWYQWIEKVHTYTLAANIGVSGVPYRKFREGFTQPPPFGEMVTKNTSGGRGLNFREIYNTVTCRALPKMNLARSKILHLFIVSAILRRFCYLFWLICIVHCF